MWTPWTALSATRMTFVWHALATSQYMCSLLLIIFGPNPQNFKSTNLYCLSSSQHYDCLKAKAFLYFVVVISFWFVLKLFFHMHFAHLGIFFLS